MTEPKVMKRQPPAFLQKKEQEAMKVTKVLWFFIFIENRGVGRACKKSVDSGK
jgi:hypothetical protein